MRCWPGTGPAATPLRLDLLLAGERGVAGVLDLNGPKSVRVDTELLDALRAQPGVRTVEGWRFRGPGPTERSRVRRHARPYDPRT